MDERRPQYETWTGRHLDGREVTLSERVGTALIVGALGEELRHDTDAIARAFANELTSDEIGNYESRRDQGAAERFGPGGRFGWVE
ncbi:hypothetical protein KC960_04265 [Candidatus Saccharibacteria bacterium]|nr:hypothetical protein [Candidatus Saccharibacteria bacterium]